MTDVLLIVGAVSALFLAFGLPALLKAKTFNLRKFEEHSTRFFDKVEPLLSDGDTPLPLVEVIQTFNRLIGTPRSAKLVLHVLFRASPRALREESHKTFEQTIFPFFKRRPELEKAYTEVVFSFMMSAVWSGKGVTGILLRYFLQDAVTAMDLYKVSERISLDQVNRRRHRSNRFGGHDAHVHLVG